MPEILPSTTIFPILKHQIDDARVGKRHVAFQRGGPASSDRDGAFDTGRFESYARDFIHRGFDSSQ